MIPVVFHRYFIQSFAYFLFNIDPYCPKPHIYCELGINKGKTFNLVAPVFDVAYAVDVIDFHEHVKHNNNLKWFHGHTSEFFKTLTDERFDLVYIDTDCTTLDDFNGIFPYVKDNGFILIHDTYPPNQSMIDDWLEGGMVVDAPDTAWYIRTQREDCEIATIPFANGISIIRKADRQLLWK